MRPPAAPLVLRPSRPAVRLRRRDRPRSRPSPRSRRGRPSRRSRPNPPASASSCQRTIAAGRRLVNAHVTLARAELAVILADAKQVAIKVGIALALVLYIAVLVPVGTALFLGEWIFGSMAWGILHGTLFSIATAFTLVLAALRVSGRYLAGSLLGAILIGAVVAVVLGYAMPNAAYASIAKSAMPSVDPGVAPLLVGLTLWGTVFAFVGLVGGARAGGVGGALGGFVVGALVGALFGAFTAISFSLQVGVAIGVSVTLVAWPAFGALALRHYDWEALKRRFTPSASIAAAEETRAWAEARLPGRREEA